MSTPIPVTRQVVPATANTDTTVAIPEEQPQTFTDMQKKMENEMESRRMEWEKEVEKMQQDFFNLKPKDRSGDNKKIDVAVSASKAPIRRHGTEIIDISNTKNLYAEKPDGSKVYRLRFDVREFEPGEIHVKAEGHVLYISAEHQDDFGSVKKVAKQFSRQMDLPEAVDPDKIEANLSSDGFLTVEAPVDSIPEEETNYKPFDIADAGTMNREIMKQIEAGGEGLGLSNEERKKLSYFQGKTPGGVEVEYDPANESYSYEHYLSGGGDYPVGDYPVGYHHHVSSTEYPVYSHHMEYNTQPGYHVTQYHSHHPGGPCPHPWSRCHQINHQHPENRMKTHQNMKSTPTKISYTIPQVKLHTGGPPTMTSELLAMVKNNNDTSYGSPRSNVAELESKLENNLSSNISSMISKQPSTDVNIASFGRYSNPLVVIVDGQRKLKLSVDIGQGFSPEEIEVTLRNNKIGIHASHEETVPWSSKRHFSREWDLPEDIESRTLRAMLTETGRIILAASCKDNKNHDAMLECIKKDMPQGGQYCRIKID